jgi:hypothetical protein
LQLAVKPLIVFPFFPVFPYAHKKFSKSKQLAESIDDICNNIWNKKKQRPENVQTGDKQRPENEQTGDKQRPENEKAEDKQRPENDQTGDKQRPENDQTGDKQRPENDQKGDKQRPENYQKGDTQRQEDGHLQGTIGPQKNQPEAGKSSVSGVISRAGCQPMFDTGGTYFCKLSLSVADPNPQDPYVFGPP